MLRIIELLTDEIYRMELLTARLQQTGLSRRAGYRRMEIGRFRKILDLARKERK